ncbi:hypothetical protein BDV96DRAFT_569206 [Lophiotrema nucula]|uniref:Uncharacterized protein n=1 Tax=Lophiotrema nucula TaxID=690887 RepID=A0A6A5ZIB3_9PLEO|nr:hypothetical protein BDV96DRAFT_569206 [Lophiotrema nucula]
MRLHSLLLSELPRTRLARSQAGLQTVPQIFGRRSPLNGTSSSALLRRTRGYSPIHLDWHRNPGHVRRYRCGHRITRYT